jgi:hypothetical protein
MHLVSLRKSGVTETHQFIETMTKVLNGCKYLFGGMELPKEAIPKIKGRPLVTACLHSMLYTTGTTFAAAVLVHKD